MKKLITILTTLILCVNAFAQTTNKDALLGTWLTGSSDGKVGYI